jgi:large subunit ribosomal protein L34
MKRTYQPHNKSRLRTHGFRKRNSSPSGQKVLSNRRRKGRKRLAPTIYKKSRERVVLADWQRATERRVRDASHTDAAVLSA